MHNAKLIIVCSYAIQLVYLLYAYEFSLVGISSLRFKAVAEILAVILINGENNLGAEIGTFGQLAGEVDGECKYPQLGETQTVDPESNGTGNPKNKSDKGSEC